MLQQGALQYWKKMLGEESYDAMLYKSDITNLTRFATTFHLKLASDVRVEKAILTEKQRRFHDFTCQILNLSQNKFIDAKVSFKRYEKTSVALGTRYVGSSDSTILTHQNSWRK